MPGFTESEAPSSLRDAVNAIEAQADATVRSLGIFSYPRGLASWAMLTANNRDIEAAIEKTGFANQQHAVVMLRNGKVVAEELSLAMQYATDIELAKGQLLWTDSLALAAHAGLQVAKQYFGFTSVYPVWHQDGVWAELLGEKTVRFTDVDERPETRRVQAYQQGIRPPGKRPQPGKALSLPATLERGVKQKIANLVRNSLSGSVSFSYGHPLLLWRTLFQQYVELLGNLFRRGDSLDLGGFNLGDFRRTFAAILAVCSVHEHFSYEWRNYTGRFPYDSSVVVWHKRQWIERLAGISSVAPAVVEQILRELTLGATRAQDLFVHPFVSLDSKGDLLAVDPHIPLKSRADENVLRVCSYLRPTIYDSLSALKEQETREDLLRAAPPGLCVRGPRTLPNSKTDIDLIVEDTEHDVVVIAELKWLRMSMRPGELKYRRAEFLKGVQQLGAAEAFLQQNPAYLYQIGDVTKPLNTFSKVYYTLIARDFFTWVDPKAHCPVVEYEPFSQMLGQCSDLAHGMEELLRFDWLPVEGRDFRVQYDRDTVGDVSLEGAVIYPSYL